MGPGYDIRRMYVIKKKADSETTGQKPCLPLQINGKKREKERDRQTERQSQKQKQSKNLEITICYVWPLFRSQNKESMF